MTKKKEPKAVVEVTEVPAWDWNLEPIEPALELVEAAEAPLTVEEQKRVDGKRDRCRR